MQIRENSKSQEELYLFNNKGWMYKKVLIYTVFAMCLAFWMCVGICVSEVNADSTMLTLEEGKTYSLSFPKGTTPHLKYVMPSKGYFYYEVTPTYYTDDGKRVDATFYFDVNMAVKNKIYEKNRFVYNGTCEKSSRFSFKKGTVIDLSILNETDSAMGNNIMIHYDIKITVVKPKNFEKESNNSKKSANVIKKGITYIGLVMVDDIDYYVFKAPKTKRYKISAAVTSSVNSVDDLRVEALKKGRVCGSKRACYGDGYETIYNGKLRKGEKIYLKVSGGGDVKDMLYKLKVK